MLYNPSKAITAPMIDATAPTPINTTPWFKPIVASGLGERGYPPPIIRNGNAIISSSISFPNNLNASK
ncbi:MAG: hypothetical protein LM589_04425 [Thermosphaera sp.]|nr:hypothetical protein [Thermosphaera sp.]